MSMTVSELAADQNARWSRLATLFRKNVLPRLGKEDPAVAEMIVIIREARDVTGRHIESEREAVDSEEAMETIRESRYD